MRKLIEHYLNEYMAENGLTLTEEQYQQAYNGVEFWLTNNLPEATSDSIKNVI